MFGALWGALGGVGRRSYGVCFVFERVFCAREFTGFYPIRSCQRVLHVFWKLERFRLYSWLFLGRLHYSRSCNKGMAACHNCTLVWGYGMQFGWYNVPCCVSRLMCVLYVCHRCSCSWDCALYYFVIYDNLWIRAIYFFLIIHPFKGSQWSIANAICIIELRLMQ